MMIVYHVTFNVKLVMGQILIIVLVVLLYFKTDHVYLSVVQHIILTILTVIDVIVLVLHAMVLISIIVTPAQINSKI